MIAIMMFQKGTPDIINLILPLIAILLCLLAVNNLYEWLKTKPWKKSGPPEETILGNEMHTPPGQSPSEEIQNHPNQPDSENQLPLQVAAIV
ncbi:MAG: hypothetical protein HY800_09785 [Ignavibacteriales bacterium]|nr:hypothetical protein [Ignavibacteriales bacterium]